MGARTSRKIGTTVLVLAATIGTAAVVTTAKAPVAQAGNHDHEGENWGPQRYSIALWGDMPYNALGKQQYPALLADVNAANVAFSVFDGDLKAGGDGPCTDANL